MTRCEKCDNNYRYPLIWVKFEEFEGGPVKTGWICRSCLADA